eukprot:351831-Chlamydomonas_euryale.AAC.6
MAPAPPPPTCASLGRERVCGSRRVSTAQRALCPRVCAHRQLAFVHKTPRVYCEPGANDGSRRQAAAAAAAAAAARWVLLMR